MRSRDLERGRPAPRSRASLILPCAVSLVLATTTGCSTVFSVVHSGPGPRLYGGTTVDWRLLSDSETVEPPAQVYGWVDLPFSFAADTAILPLQMSWWWVTNAFSERIPHRYGPQESPVLTSTDSGVIRPEAEAL